MLEFGLPKSPEKLHLNWDYGLCTQLSTDQKQQQYTFTLIMIIMLIVFVSEIIDDD